MSWDSHQYDRHCPCGKGKIIVTIESDDWNRSRSSEEILCEECRKKEIQRLKKIEDRNKRFAVLTDQVISKFKEKYLTDWFSLFDNANTKKQVWEMVVKLNIESYSIQTFYSRHKSLTKNEYLENLIKLEKIPLIIRALNIEDNEIENMISEPLEIQRHIYNEGIAAYKRNL